MSRKQIAAKNPRKDFMSKKVICLALSAILLALVLPTQAQQSKKVHGSVI
jgi:hypothetical protein